MTYYHQDQLGSTRVLSNATGRTVASSTYDAYGQVTASLGASTSQPFGFAGEYTDAETGFVYLRARYYDPGTGQFLTRDPIEAKTREPYGYVNGNPLNGIDPSGLRPDPHPTGGGPNGGCPPGYFPDRQSGRCISNSVGPPNYITEPGNGGGARNHFETLSGMPLENPPPMPDPFPTLRPSYSCLRSTALLCLARFPLASADQVDSHSG